MLGADLDVLTSAAEALTITARGNRWTHLSLCVLDAAFSINAHYSGTVRVCERYAQRVKLPDFLLPADMAGHVVGTAREEPVSDLHALGRELGAQEFATDVLSNRGRTSPRNGVLKAEAAIRYANILTAAGVLRLGDVRSLLADPDELSVVESKLRTVPGHGQGARLSYLWMLAGDDNLIKADRMILRWLSDHLHRRVAEREAQVLVAELSGRIGCTPWELDQAIWRRQSGRS